MCFDIFLITQGRQIVRTEERILTSHQLYLKLIDNTKMVTIREMPIRGKTCFVFCT